MSDETYTLAVLGAGPAAIYGADKLADAGHDIVMLNRDIKPGGLAEFGIYPTKYRMKGGLRQVFRRILDRDRIHYIGNVKAGMEADIRVDEIRDLGFDAIVTAVGAQGTRWLGLPGEDAEAVFHAKDLVYHFNKLPPFSEREYPIGDDVCVIGLGNVCLDIVHWLSCEKQVDSVTAVYRRGPAERPCTERELKIVSGAMDVEQIQAEIDAIAEDLERVDQDPEEEFEDLVEYADEPLEAEGSPTDFRFRFLRSPVGIETDEDGQVTGLEVEKNALRPPEDEDDRPGIEGTGEHDMLSCDTVIFAIGDKIEPSLGLPLDPDHGEEFATVPGDWDKHPDRPRYMVWDPDRGEPLWDTFVVGWAREASDGLVGKAKQDAEQGCDEILAYLDGDFSIAPGGDADPDELLDDLLDLLDERDVRYVTFPEVQALEDREERIADERNLEEFKFSSIDRMLEVLDEAG